MKKGIIILSILVILLSTFAYAVSYGSRITRIQTLPGEEARAEIEEAKAAIGYVPADTALEKLDDLSAQVNDLKATAERIAADASNGRTETNVQLSNVLSAVSSLKTQLDGLSALKRLPQDLPPLLEGPREIITPRLLVNLSVLNLALLIVLIGLVLFVKREHSAEHIKTVPHGHPELHDYIKQHIKKGVHINTIRSQLVSHDWDPDEVDEAVRQVRES